MNTITGENKAEIEAEELKSRCGQEIRIHGSIYKIRKMSGFAFVLLRTKRAIVQCTYSEETSGFPLEELTEEACVIFAAQVVKEERSRTGFELRLTGVQILSMPEQRMPIPINQKEVTTSLEHLLDYRPLTLRNERERAIFKIQAGIGKAFREYLDGQGFTEIHTPKIVAAGAEGGANIFPLSYFGKQAYLAQSPQFYKQMMVGVFDRVFETAPVFRAEKHNTTRHLNEYTSLDLEMGYIDGFEDLMALEASLLRFQFSLLKKEYARELALLSVTLPDSSRIPAVRFEEAKRLVSEKYNRAMRNPYDLEPEEEQLIGRYFKEEYGSDLVFVTHYPSKKRPFYAMDDPDDRRYTLSFDLLFDGMEVTTGGQRIHSYREQVEKMRARGMNPEEFEHYLMIHKYGMPPHGGLGIGLERLTMKLIGESNVREAALFPRDVNRLEP